MARHAAPAIFRYRLLLGADAAFGPGKAELRAAIQHHGSIATAGRRLGMSYKRAWQLAEETNRIFREPLIEAGKGGAYGDSARVTPFGIDVLESFRAIETRAGARRLPSCTPSADWHDSRTMPTDSGGFASIAAHAAGHWTRSHASRALRIAAMRQHGNIAGLL